MFCFSNFNPSITKFDYITISISLIYIFHVIYL